MGEEEGRERRRERQEQEGREREEQVGEMGGEGRASRGENSLTQFHMQVCLLVSRGCLTQSPEWKELDYFIIQSPAVSLDSLFSFKQGKLA